LSELILPGVTASRDVDYAERGLRHLHQAPAGDMPAVAAAFRDAGYYLEHITCLDLRLVEEVAAFRVDYQFCPVEGRVNRHVVQATVAEGQPATSITGIYPGAEWYEREAHELYGVQFDGHPGLTPLLLYEGFDGFPGRREYPFHDYQEF